MLLHPPTPPSLAFVTRQTEIILVSPSFAQLHLSRGFVVLHSSGLTGRGPAMKDDEVGGKMLAACVQSSACHGLQPEALLFDFRGAKSLSSSSRHSVSQVSQLLLNS
jgi:hypothetical protein